MSRSTIAKALAAIVAVLLAIAGVVALTGGDDDGKQSKSVVVTLGGQGKHTITLPPAAQAVATAQANQDAAGDDVAAESDLREGHAPPAAAVKAAERLTPPGQPAIPQQLPQAAQSTSGCTSAFVRNQSSRNGAPILLGVIHWTASRNIAGRSDVLGITSWFNNSAAQASSNYITDDEGHCQYVVPETSKAWTQAGFNPWSLSVEIVNPGVQPLFGAPAGRAAVVKLMRGWHSRWGIPYRRGAVNGCQVTRSGFLAHRDLGACGGGHPDVGTFNLDGLIKEAGSSTSTHVTARTRSDCAAIYAYRQRRKAGKPKTAEGTASFNAALKRVAATPYKCVDGKPRRRS